MSSERSKLIDYSVIGVNKLNLSDRIALFKEAASDLSLARHLASLLGLDSSYTDQEIQSHFGNTAEMLVQHKGLIEENRRKAKICLDNY